MNTATQRNTHTLTEQHTQLHTDKRAVLFGIHNMLEQ